GGVVAGRGGGASAPRAGSVRPPRPPHCLLPLGRRWIARVGALSRRRRTMDRRRAWGGRPSRVGALGSRVAAGRRGALATGGDVDRLPRSRLGPARPHPSAGRAAPAARGSRQRRAESPRRPHEGPGPPAHALSRPLSHGAALHFAARELPPRSHPAPPPPTLPPPSLPRP